MIASVAGGGRGGEGRGTKGKWRKPITGKKHKESTYMVVTESILDLRTNRILKMPDPCM